MSDPRLKNMIRLLNNLKAPGLTSIEDLKLDANSFKSVLNENMVLITKALQNQVQAEPKMSSQSPFVTGVAKKSGLQVARTFSTALAYQLQNSRKVGPTLLVTAVR